MGVSFLRCGGSGSSGESDILAMVEWKECWMMWSKERELKVTRIAINKKLKSSLSLFPFVD